MKKKKSIIVLTFFLMIIGFFSFAHFTPHFKLVGSWIGDGTLDLIGDSPFDGAIEITFSINGTGYAVTERGLINFSYEVPKKHKDIITLDCGNGYIYGERFFIDKETFNIIITEENKETVSFIRK